MLVHFTLKYKIIEKSINMKMHRFKNYYLSISNNWYKNYIQHFVDSNLDTIIQFLT